MQSFGWARIAVYYAPDDPYALYYREVLEHAGLRAETLETLNSGELSRTDVLLLAGKGTLTNTQNTVVSEWVEQGGSLVCSGSTWDVSHLLGISDASSWVSNSLVMPTEEDRLWPERVESVRFFGGATVSSINCQVIATCDGRAIFTRKPTRKGFAIYLGVHVGQTMCLMQNGRAVECDGIGPDDGSAILDDGKLRAEDGTALDFTKDRKIAGETPFFAYPHADIVKELWIRAILNAVDASGHSIPMFWHWPNHANGSAVLSLDCEKFESEKVSVLHRVLTMFGCPAAWIVSTPGYSTDVYRSMRAWDHEVGLLFQTDDGSGWHEEKLKIQLIAIGRLSATPALNSVRPVDGKWRGWMQFYELCENAGARMSLSKGGRQPGTSGFLFGTCHPYFPINRDGRSFLTGELPYTIYMPGDVTPDAVSDQIIQTTLERNGCLHVVMSPEAAVEHVCAASLRRILSLAKQSRLEFMLPDQIYRYEKAKRQVRSFSKQLGDEGTLQLASDSEIEGLSLLLSGPRLTAEVKGRELSTKTVRRYGTEFTAITLNLQPKQQIDLHVRPLALAKAA